MKILFIVISMFSMNLVYAQTCTVSVIGMKVWPSTLHRILAPKGYRLVEGPAQYTIERADYLESDGETVVNLFEKGNSSRLEFVEKKLNWLTVFFAPRSAERELLHKMKDCPYRNSPEELGARCTNIAGEMRDAVFGNLGWNDCNQIFYEPNSVGSYDADSRKCTVSIHAWVSETQMGCSSEPVSRPTRLFDHLDRAILEQARGRLEHVCEQFGLTKSDYRESDTEGDALKCEITFAPAQP